MRLQNDLQALVKKFNLAEEHFQIDTSGEPIIVQEGSGEHVILPTHFEKGAYLSQPHADHHLALKADQLPKIRFGRYIRLGRNVGVNAGGNINIGDAVWLSPGSYLLKQNHDPYGRPSIGARTVLMTQLPSIKICDFAWIGKEAVIGWDADYIGKASIVATRSFLNSWVGDYTITGSQGKVIQYFPYKAAAFELLDLDLESMLRVSDWEKVNELWLKEYKLFLSKYRCKEPLPSVRGLLTDANRRGARMLDMSPKLGDNIMFAAKLGLQVDAVARDRKAFPFILQRLQDQNYRTVRLRGEVDSRQLPFASAKQLPLRNTQTGYDFVLNIEAEANECINKNDLIKKLSEAARIGRRGCQIVMGVPGEYEYAEIIRYAEAECGLTYLNQSIEENCQMEKVHTVRLVKN